jgi:hypothetical protein
MNNKIHSSILSPSGRLFAAGLVAMAILAARLQAQYVSTVISNSLDQPCGVTTDPGGNVYVTDANNNRIVKYVPGTSNVSTLAGNDGPLNFGTNNGTGSAARFFQPKGIVYVPALGGLVVVDQGNQQLRFVSLGGAVSNLAGMTGVSGSNNGAALGQAQFSYPTALAVANDGATLYIADQGNNLIRVLATNHMVTNLPVGGYQFNSPSGVAVDNNSNIWVADSLNHVICMISNGMTQVIAGNGQIGSSDSLTALTAEFKLPGGLLWDNANNLLVISDTLNDTIRSLFWTNVEGVSGYAVQTITGVPVTQGYIDGALGVAEFNQPAGLCIDKINLGYYVVDTDNNVLRVLQPTQPPPPSVTTLAATSVTDSNATLNATVDPNGSPVTVYFEWGADTNYGYVTTPVTTLTNNLDAATPVSFTLPGLQPDTVAHFQAVAINNWGASYGGDRSFITTALEPDVITLAASSVTSSNATLNGAINPQNVATSYYFEWGATTNYGNFTATNILPANLESPQDVAAVLTNLAGSASNHFQLVAFNYTGTNFGGDLAFVTLATPPVLTISPASGYFPECQTITVTSSVSNVFYTTDGSTPSTNSLQVLMTNGGSTNFVGTVQWCNSQADLSALQLIAVNGVLESQVLAGASPPTNQLGFVRSPTNGIGSTAFIPIVLDLQSNTVVKSLQFRVEVTPVPPNTNMIASLSLLPITTNDFVQMIGPAPGNAPVTFNIIPYTDTVSSNGQGLLISTYGPGTGLDIENFGVVGLLEFQIPASAQTGQTYSLNILYPSGTSDGLQAEVPMASMAPATLTVADLPYLVGDSSPSYGYSAEEFGDGILDNDDVDNVIYASMLVRVPPVNSDAYNAMDAWPPLRGDGLLQYLDWYHILLRSVDLETPNWIRFWTNGGILEGVTTTNGLPGDPAVPTEADMAQASGDGSPPGLVWFCHASIRAGTVTNLSPGNTCSLPVYANVLAGCSLAGFQFRAIVSPNGNAPPVGQVLFNPAEGIPSPQYLPGLSANDILSFWTLGAFKNPLQNSNYIGTISFQVPSNAQAGQSYAVHFMGVHGVPDDTTEYTIESFPGYAWVRSAALQPASITSDEWKLYFFGSLTNSLAGDDVDADGDGAPNWQEYLAGTDPTNPGSVFQFGGAGFSANGAGGVALSWLTAPGKTYILESIPALGGGSWTAINTNTGDGYTYQFIQTKYNGDAQFYRILLQP